ncbi:cartilage matrix protein [Octopus bimaculoides]|uniref:VWFA domain-containing protein n=1 Tax=Octopus bimaculoides TaxID=37653 RepID=A0A0L8GH30_OCTBM|nr:cartilage matrix protein [Octopus bimaculoides]|eukprot:XP_014781113.1 PREDICTED: cartilage matrix protein-like [Octopus bimaculoides]
MALNIVAVYLSVCLTIFTGNALGSRVCHPQPTDVIFVLDTSTSINELDYKKEIGFVSGIVRHLTTLNPAGVEVGLYTFSDTFKNNIILGHYRDKNSLLAILNGIQPLQGSTNTHLVLEDILSNGFKSSSRQNTKRVVVLITDGQSVFQAKTLQAAKALHNANIEVHAVGVGDYVDPNELRSIASLRNYSHLVSDFDSLSNVEKNINESICNIIVDPTSSPQPTEICITRPTDVIFVLDSSDSISQQEFDIQLNFVIDIVKNVNVKISANESQVGIYTFASGFVMNIGLGSYSNELSLLKAIRNIRRLHGSTNTHLALNDVLKNGYSKNNGARTGVHRVVVLITDGQSIYPDDTAKAADALHKDNIEVVAIGVGSDISKEELKKIASKYQEMHLVKNYKSLQTVLEKQIIKITCVPRQICKVRPTDVIFAIDSSSSISTEDFAKQRKFLAEFVKYTKLVISDSNVHMGLYTFADKSIQNFRLNSYKTKKDILDALNNLVQIQGVTNTHLVLQEILSNGFSTSSGARANAHHVVVLITDGQSVFRKKTIDAGKALHQAGIEVYAIGVGNATDDTELKAIASSGSTLFTVPDYHTLDLIEEDINKIICKDAKNQTGLCENGSADVVFLIDTSDSTTKKDFSEEMNIVSAFVKSLSGLDKVKVALITFASHSALQFSLTTHTTKSSLLAALQNMQKSPGSTNTADALRLAKATLQLGSNKRRAVVLITDGKSDDSFDSLQAAKDLRSSNINIFGYGISNSVISELQIISGSMSNVVIGEVSEVSEQLVSKVLNSSCS